MCRFRNIIPTVVFLLMFSCLQINAQESSLDDLIKDIFQTDEKNGNTGPSTISSTVLGPDVQGNTNDNNDLLCGSHQQCVNRIHCRQDSQTINTDGVNLIDIRIGGSTKNNCTDYLSVCCDPDKVEQKTPPPGPIGGDDIKCGYRNPDGVGFKIVGASKNEAEFGEFPWMIAVLREELVSDEPLLLYECGGSLISHNVVMTAAHCVKTKQPDQLVVRAGEWDTQTKNEIILHQDRRVKQIILHEAFNKGSLFNDVALLITDEAFNYEENVRPVCLPPATQNFDFNRCFATGWGKDQFGKDGQYQVILKKIDLPVVPRNICQKQLRKTRLGNAFILDPSFTCAGGEEGKDTCKGDGGSPLVCPVPNEPDRFFQAGIVAYGVGCGTKDVPGVYASVTYLRSWIDKQFHEHNLVDSEFLL